VALPPGCKQKERAMSVATVDQKQVRLSHVESRPNAKAVAAIVSAIQSHVFDYTADGVTFGPFRLLPARGTFKNIWNSGGNGTAITFFQSTFDGTVYLPLGDIALIGQSLDQGSTPTAPGVHFLVGASADPLLLAHPASFTGIADDHGSGNPRNIAYFTMNPPDGYIALGIAFTNGEFPNPNNYWCVRADAVRAVDATLAWSDRSQHWTSHNGSLNVPVLNRDPDPAPSMLFTPQTFLSVEGGNKSYALAMQQADLPITPFDPASPTYDPTIVAGDETEYGLKAVKIVPYTAVSDPGFIDPSPFYFIAAEPYWLCKESIPTPEGGEHDIRVTIGTASEKSTKFTDETSMTVSAEVGVEYGAASAKVSASYTHDFSITQETSSSNSTEVETTDKLILPAQPITWIWQRQTQISVFRDNTTQLAPVTYSDTDIRFIPQ
jgi:hypothetical protein